VQGLHVFRIFPHTERRSRRSAEPIAAARLYLDRLVGDRDRLRAAILTDGRRGGRVLAGSGLSARDLGRMAAAARDAVCPDRPAEAFDLRGDLFVHRVRVRGTEHVFATLGGRARRVRDVERDLARILGA
jgi:hypothetical protein